MNNITIRLEQPKDHHEVEHLVRESFWNVYRPGCTEHYVLNQLRQDTQFVDELDYILTTQSQDSKGEKTERIIGQIAYVEAHIETDDCHSVPVLTMGPLSIHPEYQGKGMVNIY